MRQINKITRQDYSDIFDFFISYKNISEIVKEYHWDGIYMIRQSVIKIDANNFPEFPKLHGFWLTNEYQWSHKYGTETDDIVELTRVKKITKTIETTEWVDVETTN